MLIHSPFEASNCPASSESQTSVTNLRTTMPHHHSERRQRRESRGRQQEQATTRHSSGRSRRDSVAKQLLEEPPRCEKDGCGLPQHMVGNEGCPKKFCEAHWYTCLDPGCPKKAHRDGASLSAFCLDHKCQQQLCNAWRPEHRAFCQNHTCSFDNGLCHGEGAVQSKGKPYCTEHRCDFRPCNQAGKCWMGHDGSQTQMSPSRYCHYHACQVDGCRKAWAGYDNYEELWKCASHLAAPYRSDVRFLKAVNTSKVKLTRTGARVAIILFMFCRASPGSRHLGSSPIRATSHITYMRSHTMRTMSTTISTIRTMIR